MISHSGDRPPLFCGLGHNAEVPYVEALAFWGRAAQERIVPRSYALGVLAGHPALEHGWPGPPTRWEKVCQAADDLRDWENVVVAMSVDDGDFFGYLQREDQFLAELAELPDRLAECLHHLQARSPTGHDSPGTAQP